MDIDKVNKPYLPMASGEFSQAVGIGLVAATGVAALAICLSSGSAPLTWTVCVSLALGVLYSMDLPFMRWKRVAWLAAGCILAVRAVIVQLGEQRRPGGSGHRPPGAEPLRRPRPLPSLAVPASPPCPPHA